MKSTKTKATKKPPVVTYEYRLISLNDVLSKNCATTTRELVITLTERRKITTITVQLRVVVDETTVLVKNQTNALHDGIYKSKIFVPNICIHLRAPPGEAHYSERIYGELIIKDCPPKLDIRQYIIDGYKSVLTNLVVPNTTIPLLVSAVEFLTPTV